MYVDLADVELPIKLCNNITIPRSVHCSNTTLRFLLLFQVSQFSTNIFINSSPSKTEIFIEECGMYVYTCMNVVAVAINPISIFSYNSKPG